MFRRLAINLAILCLALSCLAAASWAGEPSRDALMDKADSFLGLLDQGLYDEAWLTTSPHFQGLTNHQAWLFKQRLIRSAYGRLVSREFSRLDYRRSYLHSPDGEYAIIQFKSTFDNKTHTVETIVYDCSLSDTGCLVREYILN